MDRKQQINICLLATVMGVIGCAGAGDVDRTQANRLPKAMFQGEWYIRTTLIDVPPSATNGGFAGLTGRMEKIRWEIQEKDLLGYRSFEEFPGTINEDTEGRRETRDGEFRENPVIACPIESHFDIRRDYNPSTGEQRNVIEENEEDRVWHERDFIRVDWAQCQMEMEQFFEDEEGAARRLAYYKQAFEDGDDAMRIVDATGQPVNYDDLETVANANEIEVSYFDFVTNAVIEPATFRWRGREYPLCWFQLSGRDFSTTTCDESEVKLRTSIMRATKRNYQPVVYSDREMSKFGMFRTERFGYDRRYGFTESGRIYLANVHNIWEAAYETNSEGSFRLDADGKRIPIPVAERAPQPVVYHLSPRFPCEMVASAKQVEKSWNSAFRRSVAIAQGLLIKTRGDTEVDLSGIPTSAVPNMFVIDLNGWVQREAGDGLQLREPYLSRRPGRGAARRPPLQLLRLDSRTPSDGAVGIWAIVG